MKRKIAVVCVMVALAVCVTAAASAREVNLKLGPWDHLYQWQGHVVNVQLTTNIVNLRNVRLVSVQENGLVVRTEKALNLQERNQERFVPYERILTVDLVQ